MLHTDDKLKPRDLYLNQLIAFQDQDQLKIITGIRRCGKTSLLKLMQQHLLQNGVTPKQIISMNFESIIYRDMDSQAVYNYVKQQLPHERKAYIFIDEPQRVDGWEDAINSLRVDFDCDIYIAGSNAYLLASEFSTYISGRYVEIKMYPLSFQEYLYFNGYAIRSDQLLGKHGKMRLIDSDEDFSKLTDLLETYIRFGGMPGVVDAAINRDRAMALLDGIYSSVLIRDVFDKEISSGKRKMTDTALLQKVVSSLTESIGCNVSLPTITAALLEAEYFQTAPRNTSRKISPTLQTMGTYVGSILSTNMFDEVYRYNLNGKGIMKTLWKYYIADLGIKNLIYGCADWASEANLENIVYLELLRRGYKVYIGKINNYQIDFVAMKMDERLFVQVTHDMNSETTIFKQLDPFWKLGNDEKRIVLTLVPGYDDHYGKILCKPIIKWLLEEY